MCSSFLDLPLRSMRDLAGETEARIAALEAERSHATSARRDAIGDELGQLLDRLETLEDEIAWREQPRFTGGMP